jgi:hypothetical protein
MRTLLIFLFLSFAKLTFADELPKDCLGVYAGEMQAYTVTKNDIEMNIEKHDVRIHIARHDIFYSSGQIELRGAYTFLKQSSTQFLIKVNLTNGKNISYQIDLLWNKKARTLTLSGKNGEPDLILEKLDS